MSIFTDWILENILSLLNMAILIFLSLFGKHWVNKKKKDLEKDLEKIKSSFSKEQFIHRLQFEKEFKIYSELWANLIKLKNSVELSIFQEAFKAFRVNKNEIGGKLIIDLMDNINNAKRTIENNRPFYSEEIYRNALKIVELTKSFLGQPKALEESDIEHLSKLVESKDQVYKIIDDIELATRERIRNIGEAKLVG